MDEPTRKRRGPLTWLAARTWRFWVAVAAMLPVLYVGSFGPAYWWLSQPRSSVDPKRAVHNSLSVYWPLGWFALDGSSPKPIKAALLFWIFVGMPKGNFIAVPFGPDDWSGVQK